MALRKAQEERQFFEGQAFLFLPLHPACLAEAQGGGSFLLSLLLIVSMWSFVEDRVILIGFWEVLIEQLSDYVRSEKSLVYCASKVILTSLAIAHRGFIP